MLKSIELRWFSPGNLPEEVSAWFKADNLGQLLAPEQREDIYLLVAPDCDYMGVKLRHAVTALPNLRGHLANPRGQGRLEVKWRRAELGTIGFGNFLVEGKLEKWGKWCCEDSTGESFQLQDVVTKSEWITVKKVRQQRTARDCNVEITQLDINGNSWWSLAFEAIGEDSAVIANLQAVGSNIFQNYAYQQLQVQDSFAYPSWLTRSQNAIS